MAITEHMNPVSPQGVALRSTINAWSPTFPRRATKQQVWATDPDSLYTELASVNGFGPGYVSVYSFPDGHPHDGEIPEIDTVFFDFDIPSHSVYGRPDSPAEVSYVAWYTEMARLLTVVGRVATQLIEEERDAYFRASLSGHKGIHLFLDFPALDLSFEPTYSQVETGLVEYVTGLVEQFEAVGGEDIQRYLDVDSTDMARLTRMPNTIHESATRLFEEPRYCVPVTLEELTTMTPDEYTELTRLPRLPPDGSGRTPSTRAGDVLTQYVLCSPRGRSSRGAGRRSFRNDEAALEQYEADADENLTLESGYHSVESELLSRVPCMWEFRSRDDGWAHGAQSHFFECAVIIELTLLKAPLDVIQEFFAPVPGYDERLTRHRVAKIVSGNYTHSVSKKKLARKSPIFAGGVR